MEKVQLVTAEMRELENFVARGEEIDRAVSKNSNRATHKLRDLMKHLLETPSERTIEYFVKMEKRWGFLINVYGFLEARWSPWARFDQRIELLRHKYWDDPASVGFINEFECDVIGVDTYSSIVGYRGKLAIVIQKVLDNCEPLLRHQLLELVWIRYGEVVNVRRFEEAYWHNCWRKRLKGKNG